MPAVRAPYPHPVDLGGALGAMLATLTNGDELEKTLFAHNVKIVVMSGAVMLRGPVHSNAEKLEVGKIAKAVPGVSEVTNELDIKQ